MDSNVRLDGEKSLERWIPGVRRGDMCSDPVTSGPGSVSFPVAGLHDFLHNDVALGYKLELRSG